jgi:ubiquinone/menaquinone biosynthesis C-methylase UbiE
MHQADQTQHYDAVAATWGRRVVRLGYRAAYEGVMTKAVRGQSPRSVADIGTGTGELARAFCTRVGRPERLVLVDASALMLAKAKANLSGLAGGVSAHCARLEDLGPIPPVELVLAGHVIEQTRDPVATLSLLSELVEPGGHLLAIISRPHWCQWPIWFLWRHKWFSSSKIAGMARSASLCPPLIFPLGPGPPGRTSLAYLFLKPHEKTEIKP